MLYFVRRPPRCEIFRNEIRNGNGRNGNGNGRNVRCEASKYANNEGKSCATGDSQGKPLLNEYQECNKTYRKHA